MAQGFPTIRNYAGYQVVPALTYFFMAGMRSGHPYYLSDIMIQTRFFLGSEMGGDWDRDQLRSKVNPVVDSGWVNRDDSSFVNVTRH